MTMMMTGRTLVVVAHPDDEVLGCGATIDRILKQGGQVRVLILGEGSTCRYPAEQMASEEARAAIAQRRGFADKALAYLGVHEAVFGYLPCGRFDQTPIIDVQKRIEGHIQEFRPDTLITHYEHDANSDHRVTFNAVITATRPVPGHSVNHVLCFETLTSTEWRFTETFQPNLFVDIDAHIDAKVGAFNFYFPTEGKAYPFPRCEEGLRLQARMRGMQVGIPHAEAFQIVRTVLTAE